MAKKKAVKAAAVMPSEEVRKDRHGIPYQFGNRSERRKIKSAIGRKDDRTKQVHLDRSQVRAALMAAKA